MISPIHYIVYITEFASLGTCLWFTDWFSLTALSHDLFDWITGTSTFKWQIPKLDRISCKQYAMSTEYYRYVIIWNYRTKLRVAIEVDYTLRFGRLYYSY